MDCLSLNECVVWVTGKTIQKFRLFLSIGFYSVFMHTLVLLYITAVLSCWGCSIPVIITTNLPLVDEKGNQILHCDNSTITLTCEVNLTFNDPMASYQWVSSLEYETFDEGLSVITVELRSEPVNYSCIVTDGYISGYSNITIISTCKPVCHEGIFTKAVPLSVVLPSTS